MPAIDKQILAEIMRKNRASLGMVDHWISDADYENSIFQYGLPRPVRSFIDSPIGDVTTYSDVIAYFAGLLTSPVRYLELGVSVGKNFFQMLHQFNDAWLVGLDIEDINPVLARFLSPPRSRNEWPAMASSLRQKPSHRTEYDFLPNGNRVSYIAGDVFDDATWRQFEGQSFNLVFSDAYHSADALMREWDWIKRLKLLDADEFVMLWDDLDSPEMQRAFGAIAGEMMALFGIPVEEVGLGPCRGWLGTREPAHTIGFVRKGRHP